MIKSLTPEKQKEHSRKWFKKHPNYSKEWREQNPNYHREWIKKHPNYSKNQNKKHYFKKYKKRKDIGLAQATWRVHYAIKTNKLLSLSKNFIKCTDCDKRATVYDHRNYNKPFSLDTFIYCSVQHIPRTMAKSSSTRFTHSIINSRTVLALR